ncbi:MAG: helix-turn-helix domain-containing protein [Hyphomicrobiaceae bacterium]
MGMIAACLRPLNATMQEARSPIQDVALLRAKRIVESNLHSPRLTPDFLCKALGVSRRSLYRSFERLGGVHHYILQRRLSRIRRELNNPDNLCRIADLAESYGFSRQETFWRAFKRRYGATPGDIQAHRALNVRNGSNQPVERFDRWLQELTS